jgi:hypothetical protein
MTIISRRRTEFAWSIAAASMLAALASPRTTAAQVRLSVGAGAGVAGSTDQSLSFGRGGVLLTGQLARVVLPFVGIGAEVNHWSRSGSSLTFATGIVQVHVPMTGLLLKAGAGYGAGDPDGLGRVSGVAGQLGAAYDLTLPGAPIAITLFANGALAYSPARSAQLVGGGLALTFR